MQAWAARGIAGRGILLDYGRYAEANNIKPIFYDNYEITYKDLVTVAKTQGIDLRPAAQGGDVQIGDILVVRSGFLKNANSLTDEERAPYQSKPHQFGPHDGQRYIGVEQSEEMLDFLHDSYFSAVAGDHPAFESWPSHKGRLDPLLCFAHLYTSADLSAWKQTIISTRNYCRSGVALSGNSGIWRSLERNVRRGKVGHFSLQVPRIMLKVDTQFCFVFIRSCSS